MNSEYKRIGIIIPARYKSSRLPGKPLIDLAGKSMIMRTWERCVKALPSDQVFVATDSEEIEKHCLGFGAQVIMTSDSCLTGTDRLVEANESLDLDLVINVQGDEPIINPKDILEVIDFSIRNRGSIVNAVAVIHDKSEYLSLSIPKVAMTETNKLLYMSRSPIPGSKSQNFEFAYKQICIYGFPKKALELFKIHPRKTKFETVEDIEILRFLELDMEVRMVEVSGNSMAVDTEDDVIKVSKIISNLES